MKGYFSAGAGTVLETKYLSVNTMLYGDKEKNFDLQTGFAVDMGNIRLVYNYRFNLSSGSSLLPFSLLHQTAIALGLHNVDKRRLVKAIKYPHL
jgi:hypothetical protein